MVQWGCAGVVKKATCKFDLIFNELDKLSVPGACGQGSRS